MRDVDREFRLLLAAAINRDRARIAGELNNRLGRPANGRHPVTQSKLDEFTRNIQHERESHFPAAWLPLICDILGDDALARHLLPERLQGLVSIGEVVSESPGPLERALAELRKYAPRKAKKEKARARS